LTSLKLLTTPVGVIVLSAGVGNDVVGWILLALCVALVNSGAGLTALWILLVSVGYCIFLAFGIRPAFLWVLRKSGSLANGPTQAVVALTILLTLASSFFTAIIGIHAIFGAFMIGLICPHEGGFAIKLTEKIEDLVSVLFLPLYFALSGLNTNLGLLDSGITWAYVVGVCAVAFFGKIAGGTLASRLNGLVWRESLTIGCLMSCKGLVELIVLNIGLQARILSSRTFTIFVVMALVTTFATTPLVVWLYPPWYQQKLDLWKKGKIDWEGNPLHPENDHEDSSDVDSLQQHEVTRKILVYLRLDGLPSLFMLVSLLASKREALNITPQEESKTESGGLNSLKQPQAMTSVATLHRPVRLHGLRLVELTERESSVMTVSEIEEYATRDPIIKAFGTFGQSREISVGGQIAVVPERSFSSTLMRRAKDLNSDFVLIPWSETGTMSEYPSLFDEKTGDPLANREFAKLVSETYEKARSFCHVGVFIDKTVMGKLEKVESPTVERPPWQLTRTTTGISMADKMQSVVDFKLADSGRQRMIVLYQGGADDIFAVKFALQLARNEVVNLKIIRAGFSKEAESNEDREHYEFDTVRASIPDKMQARVTFVDTETAALEAMLSAAHEPSSAETVIIIGRGSMDVSTSLTSTSSRDESRALGPLATSALSALRERAVGMGLMIVQAKCEPSEGELRRKTTNLSEEE
jgi:Sodium/hydrogen exchanger family